jgi:hypothetical protein
MLTGSITSLPEFIGTALPGRTRCLRPASLISKRESADIVRRARTRIVAVGAPTSATLIAEAVAGLVADDTSREHVADSGSTGGGRAGSITDRSIGFCCQRQRGCRCLHERSCVGACNSKNDRPLWVA